MSEHDTGAKRTPTPDELIRWVRALKHRSIFPKFSETIPKLTMMADALEEQRDQIQQAREYLQGAVDHGLPPNVPIWREIKAFLAANPAPAATKCEFCGAPMDDGRLHSIPGNDRELCSHIIGK